MEERCFPRLFLVLEVLPNEQNKRMNIEAEITICLFNSLSNVLERVWSSEYYKKHTYLGEHAQYLQHYWSMCKSATVAQ